MVYGYSFRVKVWGIRGESSKLKDSGLWFRV